MNWSNPKGRMSCREARGLLEPYTRGDLDMGRVHAVASHLGACAVCQEEFENCFAVRCALDSYPRIEASPDFNLRVLNQVEANTQAARLAAQPAPARASWWGQLGRPRHVPVLRLFGSAVAGVSLGLAMGITLFFPTAWPSLYSACSHAVIMTLQGRPAESVTRDLSIASTNAVTPSVALPDKETVPESVVRQPESKTMAPVRPQR